MGEIVELKPVNLAENHEFVADCCRFQEGILTEARMKLKYGFADSVWERLGDDATLLMAVEDEKIRRIRTGQSKREKAQLLVTKAPDVVSAIMLDPAANPRHRIDAAASLDKFAANGPEAAPAADRFIIRIDLSAGGGDVLQFNKSIAIDANDGEANDGTTAPQRPVVIANKPWDDSDDAAVAQADAKTPVKTPIEHEPNRVVERKTPQQIALESMMKY